MAITIWTQPPYNNHHQSQQCEDSPAPKSPLNTGKSFSSLPDSSRIRVRYLQRLGVVGNSPSKPKISRRTMAVSKAQQRTAASKLEVLKMDHGKKDPALSPESPPLTTKPNVKSRVGNVSFRSTVVVHSIPNGRLEYSERVKQDIWVQKREFEESATRNSIEFASEGWDWRQATEEKDFVLYQGYWTHPAHVLRQCNLQRHFLMILSAQQQYNRSARVTP